MSCNAAKEMSKLLDLHLSRAIEKHKRPLPPTSGAVMRKFLQLAEDVESDLKEFDKLADELNERRLEARERVKGAVNVQHKIQDRVIEGVTAMEKAAEAAGMPRENTRTAAELAEIEKREAEELARAEAQRIAAGEVGKVEAVLGEGGGSSAETFQPGQQRPHP